MSQITMCRDGPGRLGDAAESPRMGPGAKAPKSKGLIQKVPLFKVCIGREQKYSLEISMKQIHN